MSYQNPNEPRPYGSGPQQPYSPPPGGPYPPQQPPPPPGGSYPPQYPQGGPPGYGYASPPGQPGFGGPPGQPGYGPPPGRPGAVTAAAVIAFVMAAFQLLSGFTLFAAGAAYTSLSASEQEDLGMASSGLFYVLGILSLILGAVLIWGGMSALQGKSSKPLLFTALALLVLSLLNLVLGQYMGVIAIIAYAVIVVLLQLQPSKDFFASRGPTAP